MAALDLPVSSSLPDGKQERKKWPRLPVVTQGQHILSEP